MLLVHMCNMLADSHVILGFATFGDLDVFFSATLVSLHKNIASCIQGQPGNYSTTSYEQINRLPRGIEL